MKEEIDSRKGSSFTRSTIACIFWPSILIYTYHAYLPFQTTQRTPSKRTHHSSPSKTVLDLWTAFSSYHSNIVFRPGRIYENTV